MSFSTASARTGRSRPGLTAGRGTSYQSPLLDLFEALDELAGLLLELGWIVRMPRTAPDSEVGTLAVSARAFSPATTVHLDVHRRLWLVRSTGERLSVPDVATLVRALRDQQGQAPGTGEAVAS